MCAMPGAVPTWHVLCTEAHRVSLATSSCADWQCAGCPWPLHEALGAAPVCHAANSGQGMQFSHEQVHWPGSATCIYVQHSAPAGVVVFSLHGHWLQVCSSVRRVCREGCHHARQGHNVAAANQSEEINCGWCLCSQHVLAASC